MKLKTSRILTVTTLIVTSLLIIYYRTNFEEEVLDLMDREPDGERDRIEQRIAPDTGQWSLPAVPEHLHSAAEDDPELIEHIRDKWLLAPTGLPRRLTKPHEIHYSQSGQSEIIDKILKQKTHGTFIESGAGNGERLSNTLFFEKSRNWTGLLVEPNPDNFELLLRKRRNSYIINACLSPLPKPMTLTLQMANLASSLKDYTDDEHDAEVLKRKGKYKGTFKVQCFPFKSIIQALGWSTIDYFSLDVEGPEVEILKTVPFDEVDIRTFSIEYENSDEQMSTTKKETLLSLLEEKGYELYEDLNNQDIIMYRDKNR